jgi:NAD(P)-dependent dehydrogenase (short-subunit alcohol dehydrogenase family)
MSKLQGKTAVVTGAAGGLGYAIAQRFIAEGARVIGTDLDAVAGAKQVHGLGESACFVQQDVANPQHWARVAEEVAQRFGQLDILVNNAGITLMGSIEDISLEAWEKTMAVDLRGPFLGCKTMIPLMRTNGGAIINIASVSSFKPQPELVAYNTAKAGVAMMTKSIALHCAQSGYNIRANYINPGVIRTDMLDKVISQVENGEALMDSYKKMHPIGRIGEAWEIAAMATYLASDEATFITGSGFTVDGGLGINP